MNGTIKQLLRVAQYQDRNWLDVLDIVEMAVNNAPLVENDFSPYYLTYGYHPTFYPDLPEFTGAERRMKEQPLQFLSRLLADLNHVSEIFRKHQDRYVQRANKNIKARFHVGDLVLVSAAKHARDQLRPKHPLAPKASGPSLLKPKLDPVPSRSTYHHGSLADSTTPSTKAT